MLIQRWQERQKTKKEKMPVVEKVVISVAQKLPNLEFRFFKKAMLFLLNVLSSMLFLLIPVGLIIALLYEFKWTFEWLTDGFLSYQFKCAILLIPSPGVFYFFWIRRVPIIKQIQMALFFFAIGIVDFLF